MKTRNNPKLWAILVFILSFLLYLLTLPSVNVGYGDSDMLIAVGYGGGVAHPPGYPLFIALTWIFTHLPLPLSIAARAHLLSAILSASTLSVLFLSISQFLITLHTKSNPKIISFLSVSSLTIMFPYWLYSIIAEKYALNLLLGSLIIYLCIKLLSSAPKRPYPYILLFLILGVALTTHLTLWFLLPMVIYTVYFNRPKPISYLGLLIGLILPIILLWFINLRSSPPLSWHFPPP